MIKKLGIFLSPYRIAVTVAISLMLTELASELIQPLLLAKIIDDGIVQKDASVIIQWGAILLLLSLIAFLAGIINSFYAAHVSQSIGFDLRHLLYKKIQSFSFANIDQFQGSSLITRLTNDITQVQQFVFMGLRIMLRAPLLIIGGLVMSMLINIKLAAVLLLSVPLSLVLLFLFMRKGALLFRSVQSKLDKVNAVIQENLSSILLIKAFLRKDYENSRFTKSNKDLQEQTRKALQVLEIAMPLLLLIMNGSIIVILWYGGIEAQAQRMDIGEIVAIINYVTRITGALSVFTFLIMIFSRASASSERIYEIIDTEAAMKEDASPLRLHNVQGQVVFDNVSFHYPGSSEKVLQDISVVVHPKEMAAVLGATGSGKSSLIQLIPRLYDVTDGMIQIDGYDVKDIALEDLRHHIGFVAQESLLFSGTVLDNLLWGKEDATMEEVIAACQDAQIHETISRFPKGYHTVIGQKGVNLSGGQKQRLSIARALLRKPKILLLDDSTSALDIQTETKLLKSLNKYECTMIVITQKVHTAMEANKVILLEGGKIAAHGTHADLLKQSIMYQKLAASQARKESHDA